MPIERKGNCFEDSVNKLIMLRDKHAVLVHGLPTGQAGEAARAGRYPHAWVELDGSCWECSLDTWIPQYLYYQLGQIEYTVRYSMKETRDILAEGDTFGPWCQKILDRDEEIEQEFN